MVILVWFTIQIISVNEIGSIGGLYERLVELPASRKVEGNYKGSYLTMTSNQAVYFGIIHIVLVDILQFGESNKTWTLIN